jgi:adenylate cyclase
MDPEQLTQLMNAFFDPVCQAIMLEGGYIDKLIGDAVMAVFGAPVPHADHAARACRAALAMQRVVHELEPRFQKEFGITEFKLRIGLHTGPVVVGNMGTRQRLNYTVMGDTVNLASRLEGANKDLGTDILMSQATVEAAGAAVSVRYVDEIAVKGKEIRTKVYTPC